MPSMSSTLVETVLINCEDFNENFLTCGTCLCVYDGSEHTPKLLQCSHTVCLHCLTRIAASQTRDTGTFRCPICRELITIPRGGVSALPPSFIVNQLLDMMSQHRREVIPKCSTHINQELLLCETCDMVFCTLCTGGHHNDATNSSDHTIMPFSIAIKRMSEILLYKATDCLSKLSLAQDAVARELQRLDASKDTCLEQVNTEYQAVEAIVAKCKQDLTSSVLGAYQEKKKMLEEQHKLIEVEKNKVEQECEGLRHQVEVPNITQRIRSLSEKRDTAPMLGEPRENAFLTCDFKHNQILGQIEQALPLYGKVRTSTTFPSLCTAQLTAPAIAGLQAVVTLKTVDYHGEPRTTGGDPISVEVFSDVSNARAIPAMVVDDDNGMYEVMFRPLTSGRYMVKLSVFDRPIKDCPIFFDVSEHNNPVCVYGNRGSGKDEFCQPVAIAIDDTDETIYVVDTGNSRIKVLTADLTFVKHITNEGLAGRSCTGIAMSNNGLVIINWRSKKVVEMTKNGQTVKSFVYNAFQEPIDVAVDKNYGHILVADMGLSCVCVFDSDGKILFQVGKRGSSNMISSVTVSPLCEILIATTKIQMFSGKGDFTKELPHGGKGKGRFGGITVDSENRVLASRSEKGRNVIQVYNIEDGTLSVTINSNDSKLKRPSGIAVTKDHHVIVVDIGSDCIKKYRYW